ncbi:uncharacterized protein LOC127094798 [Lathyrus oleraceus]|uniref:uncharacterized protein LOC127094798 n=1 Tax=Pisum sativum TaxID=3888 RepID=UPI0021D2780B|nr:uncharacterized protein LOC127094798 [Pisum sativum]
MFAKFKEMLTTLPVNILFHDILELMPKFSKFMNALLKGMKEKVVKEWLNMTKKDEMVMPQTLPTKLKDLGKFTIAFNIGGVKIPHALCDLRSSITVMPLNKVKELKLVEIILSNMTLTLADSSISHPFGDSGGSVILELPFLATGETSIDVKTGELILNFNKEKVVFNVYEWTLYVEDLDTCYILEEKGSKIYKGKEISEVTDVRESLAPDIP